MKFRVLILMGWTAWLAPAQDTSCHPVEGDRILARHLAAVLPDFYPVPPETLLGQAPLPGSQRIFHQPELRALAHRFGITLSAAADICFEWPRAPLDRGRAVAAMQESLQIPESKIDIADAISTQVPAGRIEFPLANLGKPAAADTSAPVMWRGQIVYGEGHLFPVWARVHITAACRRLIAKESLKTGRPIEARQLRATTFACFPIGAREIAPIAEVAGMVPLRPIAAGSELRPEWIAPPNDINVGDNVRVEVRSGAARLALSAQAVTGGHTGDLISVRNPVSKKLFQARITGKGMALVEAGSPKGI